MLFAPEKTDERRSREKGASPEKQPTNLTVYEIDLIQKKLHTIESLLENPSENWYEALSAVGLQPELPKQRFASVKSVREYLFFLKQTLLTERAEYQSAQRFLLQEAGDTTELELEAFHVDQAAWKPIVSRIELLATVYPENATHTKQLLLLSRLLEQNLESGSDAVIAQAVDEALSIQLTFDSTSIQLLPLYSPRSRATMIECLSSQRRAVEHRTTALLSALFSPELITILLAAQGLRAMEKKHRMSAQQINQQLSSLSEDPFLHSFGEFYQLSNTLTSLQEQASSSSEEKYRQLVARAVLSKLNDGLISHVTARELYASATTGDPKATNETVVRLLTECQHFLMHEELPLSDEERAEINALLREKKKKNARDRKHRISTRRVLLMLTLMSVLTQSVPRTPFEEIALPDIGGSFTDFGEAFANAGKLIGETVSERLADLDWRSVQQQEDEQLPAPVEELSQTERAPLAYDLLQSLSNQASESLEALLQLPISGVSDGVPLESEHLMPESSSPENHVRKQKQVLWEIHNFSSNPLVLGLETYSFFDHEIGNFVATIPSAETPGEALSYLEPDSYETGANILILRARTLSEAWMNIPTLDGYKVTAGSAIASQNGEEMPMSLQVTHLAGDDEWYAKVADTYQLSLLQPDSVITIAFQYTNDSTPKAPPAEHSVETAETPFLELEDLPPELRELLTTLNNSPISERDKLLQFRTWFEQFGTYSLDPRNNQRDAIALITNNSTELTAAQRERQFYQVFFGTSELPLPVDPVSHLVYPQPGAGECNRRNESAFLALEHLSLSEWDLGLHSVLVNKQGDAVVMQAASHLYLFARNIQTGERLNLDVTDAPTDAYTRDILTRSDAAGQPGAVDASAFKPGGIKTTEITLVDPALLTDEERAHIIDGLTITPETEILAQAVGFNMPLDLNNLTVNLGSPISYLDVQLGENQLPWQVIHNGTAVELNASELHQRFSSMMLPVTITKGMPFVTIDQQTLVPEPSVFTSGWVQHESILSTSKSRKHFEQTIVVRDKVNIIPLLNETDGLMVVSYESITVKLNGVQVPFTLAGTSDSRTAPFPSFFLVLGVDPQLLQGQQVTVSYNAYEAANAPYVVSDVIYRKQHEETGPETSFQLEKTLYPLSNVIANNPHIPLWAVNRMAVTLLTDNLFNADSVNHQWAMDNLLPELSDEAISLIEAVPYTPFSTERYDSGEYSQQSLLSAASFLDAHFPNTVNEFISGNTLLQSLLEISELDRDHFESFTELVNSIFRNDASYGVMVLAQNTSEDLNSFLAKKLRQRIFAEIGESPFEHPIASGSYLTIFPEGYETCGKIYGSSEPELITCLYGLPSQHPFSNIMIFRDLQRAFHKTEAASSGFYFWLGSNPYMMYDAYGSGSYAVETALYGEIGLGFHDYLPYLAEFKALNPAQFEQNISPSKETFKSGEWDIVDPSGDDPASRAEFIQQMAAFRQDELSDWWLKESWRGLTTVQQNPNIFSIFQTLAGIGALYGFLSTRSRLKKNQHIPARFRKPFRIDRRAHASSVRGARAAVRAALQSSEEAVTGYTAGQLPGERPTPPPKETGRLTSAVLAPELFQVAIGAAETPIAQAERKLFRAEQERHLPDYLNPWRLRDLPPTFDTLLSIARSNGLVFTALDVILPDEVPEVQRIEDIINTGIDTAKHKTRATFEVNLLVLTDRREFQRQLQERLLNELQRLAERALTELEHQVIEDAAAGVSEVWAVIMKNWQEFSRYSSLRTAKNKD